MKLTTRKPKSIGNIVAREQLQLTIGGLQGVALLPQVQGGGLLSDLDHLLYPSPEPVALAVHDGDAVILMSFSHVLADRRGGAVLLHEPILQLAPCFSNVSFLAHAAFNFINLSTGFSGRTSLEQMV